MTGRAIRLRWGLRLASGILGALLVVCLGLALCLPWLLERALAHELSRRGLGSITIGVQAISWNQATLGPVAVCGEAGGVQASSIVLRYRPSRLRHYQIDALEVVGLRLRLVRSGATWAPRAQPTLRLALEEGLRLLPRGGAPAAYPTLDLRSSQVELEADAEVVTLPFEGTAHLAGVGPSRVQASVWVCGDPLTVDAVVDLGTGTGTATVECQRLELGAWLQTAARVGLQIPDALAAASGAVALRAQVELQGYAFSGLSAEAVVSDLAALGGPLPLRLREGVIAVRSGPDLGRLVLNFTAYSEGLALGARIIEPFRSRGRWQDGTLECVATDVGFRLGDVVHGTAQLRLTALGLTPLDRAWFDLGIDVTRLDTAPMGPFSGHLRALGTGRDLWVNGAFDAHPANDTGIAGLTVDGRLRRDEGTAVALAATLVVLPEVAAGKLGAGGRLSAPPMPLELSAAFELPPTAPWRLSGALALPSQPLTVTAPGLRASATVELEGRLEADAAGVSLAGRLETTALTAEVSGATLAADAVTISLDAWRCPWPRQGATGATTAWPPGLEVVGQVALRNGAVRLATGLQCEGISLNLPVGWSANGGLQAPPVGALGGELRAGPLRFGSFAATGFRGRCGQLGRTLRFEGELECTAPAVTISLTQTIAWDRGLALALHYAVPAFRVQGDEAWYPQVPSLGDLRLAGTLAVEGDILFDRQGLRCPCRLRLTEGELTWPQQKLTVSGLETDLRWLDVRQPRTEPFQALRFASAKVQDVPVDGGQIVFALDGPESFSLLRCELNWCGGQVHTQAVRLNPRSPELDLVLFAENVDIVQALSLVKGFTAKGSGVLNGKLPISYHGGRLSYANGYLYSVPGQTGRLALQSSGWLTSAVAKDHPAYAELQQAEKALEDFRLDLFRLEFTGKQAGTPGAKIQLAGEGANGKVPVTLNLNVKGPIEEVINLGLRLGGL